MVLIYILYSDSTFAVFNSYPVKAIPVSEFRLVTTVLLDIDAAVTFDPVSLKTLQPLSTYFHNLLLANSYTVISKSLPC